MAPTLKGSNIDQGDFVLTEKVSFWFRAPRRWEVITILRDDGARVVKRVVGLPGESVSMPNRGPLRIDGQIIEQPAAIADLRYLPYGNLLGTKPVPCNDGYYVLGDDTRDSDDSRFEGSIKAGRILGRTWLIIWPWERIGTVNP